MNLHERAEQVATNWVSMLPMEGDRQCLANDITKLLRDVVEECARVADSCAGELTQEECMNCGNQDDVATGASNDTARYIAAAIRRLKETP